MAVRSQHGEGVLVAVCRHFRRCGGLQALLFHKNPLLGTSVECVLHMHLCVYSACTFYCVRLLPPADTEGVFSLLEYHLVSPDSGPRRTLVYSCVKNYHA